jgi:hypothetical protein
MVEGAMCRGIFAKWSCDNTELSQAELIWLSKGW